MREIKFRAWDKVKKAWIPGPRWQICYHDVNVELMQYTGLKDKNDKEIYEGDIFDTVDGGRGSIVFKNGAFMTKYPSDDEPEYEVDELLYHPDTGVEDIEIIGNIHEHPELLKPLDKSKA